MYLRGAYNISVIFKFLKTNTIFEKKNRFELKLNHIWIL